MKVLLVVPSLAGGGAERVLLRVAAHLVERGHEVVLCEFRLAGAYQEAVPRGVRRVCLGARRARYSVLRLARLLRRERPDAVLATLVEANLACVLAHRLARSRARLVLRETIHLSAHARLDGRARWRVLTRLVGRLYRRADAVLANAQAMADDLVSLGVPRDRVHVVGNPVAEPALRAAGGAPCDHPWADHHPLLVAAGRLVPQKGFDVLLRALARLPPDVRLVLLGEGPERGPLLRLAGDLGVSDRVDLPGFVDPPWPLMARADLVVLSSRTEGMPNVLLQALALGTPVVATDCPSGPRELLGMHLGDALVPVDDDAALAAAIRRSLDHPPPPSALAAAVAPHEAGRVLAAYERILRGDP